MTPKGGIQPHDRFRVNARRAEVLFVDYIAEHLHATGRAGIVVPEGIIFQSQRAYKDLRKMLISEWGLYAVASLPSGIFQPYSGVKTSVLFLDRMRRSYKNILFVKIENDGFDLGAKRAPVSGSDLPEARRIICEWDGKKIKNKIAQVVAKDKIAEDGEYNLVGDRYIEIAANVGGKFPMVKLGEVASFERCKVPPFKGTKKYFATRDIEIQLARGFATVSYDDRPSRADCIPQLNDVGFALMKNTKKAFIVDDDYADCIFSTGFGFLRASEKLIPKFLFHIVAGDIFDKCKNTNTPDSIMSAIRPNMVLQIEIPLPPLEEQKRIVAEIEGYEKVRQGAQQVVDNWRPVVDVNPDWAMVKLEEQIQSVKYTTKIPKSQFRSEGKFPIIDQSENFIAGYWDNAEDVFRAKDRHVIAFGDHTQCFKFLDFDFVLGADGIKLLIPMPNFNPKFFYLACKNAPIRNLGYSRHYKELKNAMIPRPPLQEQNKIVAEIKSEEQAVAECRELAEKMAEKIAATLAKVWGEKK